MFSAVEIAIPWFLLSDAERHLTSSLTGLLVAAVPAGRVGLALLRPSGDRLAPLGLAGLLLGLLGVAALVGLERPGRPDGRRVRDGRVAVGCRAGPVILARLVRTAPTGRHHRVADDLRAGVRATGCLTWPDHRPSGRVLASIVGLAVVCTSVAFLMLFELVGEIGPVRATVFTYVNPAVAVAAGVILLGEPLTPATVIGFVLVLAGSIPRHPTATFPETSPRRHSQAVGSSGSTRAAGRTAASAPA